MEVLLYVIMTVFSSQSGFNSNNDEQTTTSFERRITFKAKEGSTLDGGD